MLFPTVLIKTEATFLITVIAIKVLICWGLFWEFKYEFYPVEAYWQHGVCSFWCHHNILFLLSFSSLLNSLFSFSTLPLTSSTEWYLSFTVKKKKNIRWKICKPDGKDSWHSKLNTLFHWLRAFAFSCPSVRHLTS